MRDGLSLCSHNDIPLSTSSQVRKFVSVGFFVLMFGDAKTAPTVIFCVSCVLDIFTIMCYTFFCILSEQSER